MKMYLHLFCFWALLLMTLPLAAQQGTIKGIVSDNEEVLWWQVAQVQLATGMWIHQGQRQTQAVWQRQGEQGKAQHSILGASNSSSTA